MIALDLDGTLADYNYIVGKPPRINHAVIRWLVHRRASEIAIVTNQGGIPWGVLGATRSDGRAYPQAGDFALRLVHVAGALRQAGIAVARVRVSTWHPKAPEHAIQRSAAEVREQLADVAAIGAIGADWTVYATARSRKPAPLMLHSVQATLYVGDSPEDAEAAANAGIEFVHVERFL